MQRALNAIEMQDHSDDDEPVQMQQQVQLAPDIVPHLAQPMQENIEPPQPEQIMTISSQAYNGLVSDATISLLLQLKKTTAVALADTGSNSTFMNYDFAIKHNIPLTAASNRTVKVAGGGTLLSNSIAHNCKFTIEGVQFSNDFRILKLQGADIILGVSWFKQYNPVTFDFIGRSMTLGINGKDHKFTDHIIPKKHFLISSEECAKLMDQGATGYVLYQSTEDKSETENDLQPPIHDSLVNLLHQFQDLFTTPTGLPPHRNCDHKIPLLPDAKPPNIRPYRMSHNQKNSIELLIKEMLKTGEIRPSHSPYSSPAILVRKKDKSWRLCVDFRALNDMTIKNKFPIPVIEDLLDELHGTTIFTKLDLRSGYHQIRMNEADVHKTAFSTHLGHYEYQVMPFGLSNAPATFQELMNSIFSRFLRKFVLVFFDDILVYSANVQEHARHLSQVLLALRNHSLKVKFSKCTFGQPQVEYLGHIINGQGVQTDPSKIQDIINWKTPQTIKKLRGFLGLTGYYRRFIKGYATICQPLHNILKKDAFHWGQEQQLAFDTLKQVMSHPPLLALPDFTTPFTMETDACASGLGAVLMQQGKPLAFFSKSLGPRASAQSIYEKEAMAILEALKKWRHYFLGNKLIIKTDQRSLKYLASQRLLEGIQHKMMLKLLEFDYIIEYKQGKENTVADALSRQFQDETVLQIDDYEQCSAISTAIPAWTVDITESYATDRNCIKLLQELAIDKDSHPKYTLQGGVIRYKGRIYIGSSSNLRDRIFSSFHSSIFGGHSGNRVTHHRIKQLFYWPLLKQFIAGKVAECPICQISKSEKVPYPGLLNPLQIPRMKWTDISMDFVEGLPKSKGKDVILVVVDRLTKFAHFIPLSHPYTVQKVADLFMENIIKLHGPPSSIVTDRDRIFTSKLWHEIFNAMQISLNFTSAYHPESDGQTERVNQCLEQYLRCMAFSEPTKWCNWLAAAEWWYNSSYHTAIKMSPFEALYEYPPPSLTSIAVPCNVSENTQVTLAAKDHMLKQLQHNLTQAQQKMKKYADLKRTERTFEEGDMVYLKMQPYRETALGMRNSLKLTSKWYGPFKVLQKVGRVAYKLQLPQGTLLHNVFHVNQLKRHLGPNAVPNHTLPLVTATGKVKIAPLAVLEHRQIPRSAGEYDVAVPQWLVHWQSMSPDEATWEDAAFIQATFPSFKP